MDPPQLPPHPTTIPTTTTSTTPPLPNYPDSSDSSPPPHATCDDPHQSVPGAKLRLMCSYGGHIIPRPHDKSLCYVGGDTRMVVVDRLSSLIDLSSRLSRTLLHGRHFNLKYQLPNEDLDSLVSVSTDEDLENMIEEYDRIASVSPARTSRLRLFLFLAKPETAASMGSLLNDAKSETWFVDALNGTGLDIPRVLSDSAAINNLLQFDDQIVHNNKNNDHFTDLEAQNEHSEICPENKTLENTQNAQEVLQSSMLDSPMVETNSSFGSSSSSPTMSNLPPIRVRAETNNVAKLQDQMAGLDEQFLHMNTSNVQNQGDGRGVISAPPPMPVVSSTSVCCASHNNRVVSDDERSDQCAATGFRKPPLPLQIVPRRHGHDVYNNLPSPDSAASDSSIASANSISKNAHNYQDPTHVPTRENTKPPSSAVLLDPNPNNTISEQANPQISTHQIQEQVYIQNPQQQHQYYHPGTHYIQHATTNAVPVQSYYQMYAPTAQSPYHQQLDVQQQQQYSMYLMPVTQTQPYKINNVQSNNATDISNVSASIYQQNLQNQPVIAPSAAKPPQFQQQYVNLSQIPHPSSSQSPGPVTGNYGYEYATHQAHEQQVYYAAANQLPPPPPQYQTMTPAAAVMLSQPSGQQAVDNGQQPMR